MGIINNPDVAKVFDGYPTDIRTKMLLLRRLVLDTASEMENVNNIEEVLKWGEPSYITSRGSTIRLGWKASLSEQYGVYFHCKTKLVDTFKELYKDRFKFEGNRAIIFNIDDDVAVNELKHCISLSLVYHDIKHLPLLGA